MVKKDDEIVRHRITQKSPHDTHSQSHISYHGSYVTFTYINGNEMIHFIFSLSALPSSSSSATATGTALPLRTVMSHENSFIFDGWLRMGWMMELFIIAFHFPYLLFHFVSFQISNSYIPLTILYTASIGMSIEMRRFYRY